MALEVFSTLYLPSDAAKNFFANFSSSFSKLQSNFITFFAVIFSWAASNQA